MALDGGTAVGRRTILTELEQLLAADAPSLDDPRWRSAVAAAAQYLHDDLVLSPGDY